MPLGEIPAKFREFDEEWRVAILHLLSLTDANHQLLLIQNNLVHTTQYMLRLLRDKKYTVLKLWMVAVYSRSYEMDNMCSHLVTSFTHQQHCSHCIVNVNDYHMANSHTGI